MRRPLHALLVGEAQHEGGERVDGGRAVGGQQRGGEWPWPGRSQRRTRCSRASAGSWGSQTAREVPMEGPRMRGGAVGGPVRSWWGGVLVMGWVLRGVRRGLGAGAGAGAVGGGWWPGAGGWLFPAPPLPEPGAPPLDASGGRQVARPGAYPAPPAIEERVRGGAPAGGGGGGPRREAGGVPGLGRGGVGNGPPEEFTHRGSGRGPPGRGPRPCTSSGPSVRVRRSGGRTPDSASANPAPSFAASARSSFARARPSPGASAAMRRSLTISPSVSPRFAAIRSGRPAARRRAAAASRAAPPASRTVPQRLPLRVPRPTRPFVLRGQRAQQGRGEPGA